MALAGVPFEDYAGLDLRSAANETGGAIDALNVEVDAPGRLRTRDGFTKFTTSSASAAYGQIFPLQAIIGTPWILGAVPNGKIEAINATTGALTALSSAGSNGNNYMVAIYGSAGGTVAYAPAANGVAGILKWDGSSFTNVATGLTYSNGSYIITTPVDNRLMVLQFAAGAADTQSLIFWSNAGAPETFSANNNLQVSPGDGETICGVCNFANQTFVFKQTRFFVFTGTTSDASGNPIFNYRTVNTGIGIPWPVGSYGGGCATGSDGVYFLGADGIYKTTGGAPVKISAAVDPIFGVGGPLPPYFQGQQLDYGSTKKVFLQVFHNRLYVTYDGTGGARGMLVYDIATQQWTYSNVSAYGLCRHPVTGNLLFSYAGLASPTGTNDIGQFASTATTDAGTNITGRYRTEFFTFDYRGRTPTRAIAGVEKIVRETIVDGMGTVSYTLGSNWTQPANLPATRTLTLGTSPQVAQARDRTAVKGRAFSMQFSGTAPWTVERTVLNVHGYQGTGLKET